MTDWNKEINIPLKLYDIRLLSLLLSKHLEHVKDRVGKWDGPTVDEWNADMILREYLDRYYMGEMD